MTATPHCRCLPEVSAFLAASPLPGVIGGRDVQAAHGETMTTFDPGSKQPLAAVAAMQPEDVDRAVVRGQSGLRPVGLAPDDAQRARRAAASIGRRGGESPEPMLAQIESLDAGKVLGQAEGDVQNFIETLALLHRTGDSRPAPQPAGRGPPRGLDCPAAVGTVRFHFPLELSHSADRLEHFSGLGGGKHRGDQAGRGHAACRPFTWPGWPARWAFPTA